MGDQHPGAGANHPIAANENASDQQRARDQPQLRLVAELAEQVERLDRRSVAERLERGVRAVVELDQILFRRTDLFAQYHAAVTYDRRFRAWVG